MRDCVIVSKNVLYRECKVVATFSLLRSKVKSLAMTNDNPIRQVHEFMVVGPDQQGLPNELAENPQLASKKTQTLEDDELPKRFAGPRTWCIKWFGPFFSVSTLPANRQFGLYLIYVGNYPLFVSSSANITIALTRHLAFAPRTVIPIDLLGREILHYARLYNTSLSIKTGLIFEDGKLINPLKNIMPYRRAAAAVAFCNAIPCNKYARIKFEFEELSVVNAGKFFPLKEKFRARPEDPAEAAKLAEEMYLQMVTPETEAHKDATAELADDIKPQQENKT